MADRAAAANAAPTDITPSPHRFEAIDSLRGFCACFVAVYHFRNNSSPIADTAFVHMSWQFVDLFFVISGFVMALNYRARLQGGMPPLRFMALRLARIYPLHVFMLAAFVAMEVVIYFLGRGGISFREAFDAGHSPEQLIKQLLFLDGFANLQDGAWNYPTWSIATEFWTYILFALCVVRAGPHLEKVLAAAAVACVVFLFFLSPRGIQSIADWGLVRCIYGFAIGVLTQAAWRRFGPGMMARATGWTAIETVTLAVVLLYVPLAGGTLWNLFAPVIFGITVLVFARQGGGISRLLMTRVPLFLGTISYSIYLVHVFVQQRIGNAVMVIDKFGGPTLTTGGVTEGGELTRFNGATPLQGTIFIIVMLALVILTASLTYRFVEKPGQRMGRRLLERTTAPA